MEEGQGYFPVKIYPDRHTDDGEILALCPDTGSACYLRKLTDSTTLKNVI